MNIRQDLAELLRAGATHDEIKQQLHVSSHTIIRTREALDIPVPPGRAKRTRAELAALEDQAVTMLRNGATHAEIYTATRLSPNRICELRRQHQIPVPGRNVWATRRLTVDEAFTRYAQPATTGGHVLWTGPRSGRGFNVTASGRTYNACHIAFQKHHGREPEGRLRRTCEEPGCIAGAHHTDHRIRQAHARADHAYTQIFGPDA